MDEQTLSDGSSFSSLVLSLAAAALAYLGHQVLPDSQSVEKNLPHARQTINTIEMLKTKTEGNRSADESKLLDELLYELRIAYVEAEKQSLPDQPAR